MTILERAWAVLARIPLRRPAPAPKRPRTKPGQIEAAIAHEIAAGPYGYATVEIVSVRHPDLLPASIQAALRRLVKAGKYVVTDGVYRAPEIERPTLMVVE